MKIKSIDWIWTGRATQEMFNLSEQVANEAMDYIANNDIATIEDAQDVVNNAVERVVKDHSSDDPDFGNYLGSCSFSPVLK